MRDRLIDELGALAHRRFLVYLMGPYEAFDVEAIDERVGAAERDVTAETGPRPVDYGTLVGSDVALDRDGAVLDLLLHVRDRLRTDPGVNAFLAIDVDVPLEEMDAATQSVAFATASNAVVYVVPEIGANLGVGIDVGAVLEAVFQSEPVDDAGGNSTQRVLFVHESTVSSAMITAISDRWDVRTCTYDSREELVDQVRLFVRDLARRERYGNLPLLDDTAERP